MRKYLAAGVLIVTLLGPNAGFSGVKVRFIHPERYTDADSNGFGTSETTIAVFRAYLELLGRRLLVPGQDISIDVLDIDLAGQDQPWSRGSEVRVLRDTTPPRFKLRYVLSERGGRTRSGEDVLSDMNYQMNPAARASSDRYGYEKALLADWFRRIAGLRQ
jgi:hypothetical protein